MMLFIIFVLLLAIFLLASMFAYLYIPKVRYAQDYRISVKEKKYIIKVPISRNL